MTQTKFEIEKRKGLKIDGSVRRGPQRGKQVGAQNKGNAAGSKLLGALLGTASEDTTAVDAAGTTGHDATKQSADKA
ncbi:hypothetical protein [Pandoraea cepalis]|uniref:Uncharacterized protein n=1 Tax=Pandoraea cepalis TaxID=2508294 RepID=A0A5E4YHC7_9BURK|nr:hypothetical protein [Pandoraea cepalis]VVE48151.1 hypothetical protein PCE31107_04534 [Pandoraea cepalis]